MGRRRGVSLLLSAALVSVLATQSQAQEPRRSDEYHTFMRRIARNLRAMELSTLGMDYDEYVALRRKQWELQQKSETHRLEQERQRAQLEKIRLQQEAIREEQARYEAMKRHGLGAEYARAMDGGRRLQELYERTQKAWEERKATEREMERVRSETTQRLEPVREEKVQAIKDMAWEGGQLVVKGGKLAAKLSPAGRLKKAVTVFDELDDAFGAADAVRDRIQEDDLVEVPSELLQSELEQRRDAGALKKLDKLVGATELAQDGLDVVESVQEGKKAWGRYQDASQREEEVLGEGRAEIGELKDDLRQNEDRQRLLDEELEGFSLDPDVPYDQQLQEKLDRLEAQESSVKEKVETGEAEADRLRGQEEQLDVPGMDQFEFHPDRPYDEQLEAASERLLESEREVSRDLESVSSELEEISSQHDTLDVLGDTIEEGHTGEDSGVSELLDEVFDEAGPSQRDEINRLADDLYERMHGDEVTSETEEPSPYEDVHEQLERGEGTLDPDPGAMLDLEGEDPLVEPGDVGAEEAGIDFDLDQSFLDDELESVVERATQDTSGDDLLSDFYDLANEMDVGGRMREDSHRIHEDIDSELGRLDEQLARDFERRRAKDSRSSSDLDLGKQLGELADHFNREMEKARGGAGSMGTSGAPNGRRRGSIRADTLPSERGGAAPPPSVKPGASMSEIYRASAKQYRWAASQTQDPAERAEYLRAAQQADRQADQLRSGR